jgi:uncharacterized coiled-coil DUF342 family protein
LSKQEKTQKIRELDQKLSTLREQRDKLNAEAREWADERDKLNQQIKNLRAEILEIKNKRDKLNEKVKELKQLREQTKREIHKKIEEIKEINQKIKALNKEKPSKSPQVLKKEFESLEWKIQTTPLSLQEEKELVERVKRLEIQLNIHRKIEQLNQKMLELKTGIKALETRRKLHHEKLTETAQKSQEIHERMLGKIGKAKGLKMEADDLHKNFLDARERARSVQRKFREILNQINLLRDEIREGEEKEKKKSEKALREKLEKRAREKVKRGEKLTWEEFQILAEKEIEAQD